MDVQKYIDGKTERPMANYTDHLYAIRLFLNDNSFSTQYEIVLAILWNGNHRHEKRRS